MNSRQTVLVTNGEQRATLAVTRSLGRAGYRVIVGSGRGHSLAAASRYSFAETRLPDPLAGTERFVEGVRLEIEIHGVDVLLPMTDDACSAVFHHPSSLGDVDIPLPPPAAFFAVSDKQGLMERARTVGIRTPEQCVVATPSALGDLDVERLLYPLVVKPARSVVTDTDRLQRTRVTHASTAAELRARASAYPEAAFPLMLQQRIEGPGVGQFFLLWNEGLVAEFSHRRIREKPPSGGVSVYRESIPMDEDLADRSLQLLRGYDWRGVAMVEYKLDAKTGHAYLMEVNGRFWGSLQLAIDAGVDFPTLLVDLSTGRPVEKVLTYHEGVRSRWWWGDFDHLLSRLRRSASRLSLDSLAPRRSRVLMDFLRIWRPGDRAEVLRLSDPRPFLRETSAWVRRQ